MKEVLVSVENVSFSYENIKVLDKVSCSIERGDFVGIIGPNGSAKSTLMKLMLGLLKPSEGSIKIFNEDISKFKTFNKIGYISQSVREFNTSFPATVEEVVGANFYSQLGFFKLTNKKAKERIEEALKIVEIESLHDKLIGNLSGGQKQRVFIARALINKPEIIFMDEPLVGVDMDSQNKFYSLMEKLNQKHNITLVMVSHDVGVISKKVNKIFCLGNGKLYAHDSNTVKVEHLLNEVYGENVNILKHEH